MPWKSQIVHLGQRLDAFHAWEKEKSTEWPFFPQRAWLESLSICDPQNVGLKAVGGCREMSGADWASDVFFSRLWSWSVCLSVASYNSCWLEDRLVWASAYACANVRRASAKTGRRDMSNLKENPGGTSLAVQWLRIQLSMQGTRVQALVGELRSHMQGTATKPPSHNYWALALQLKTPHATTGTCTPKNKKKKCSKKETMVKHLTLRTKWEASKGKFKRPLKVAHNWKACFRTQTNGFYFPLWMFF